MLRTRFEEDKKEMKRIYKEIQRGYRVGEEIMRRR